MKFSQLVWTAGLSLMAVPTPTPFLLGVDAGYHHDDEADYLQNFEAHMEHSYAAGDEASILNACREAPTYHHQVITVQTSAGAGAGAGPNDEYPTILTSSQVQQQCHQAYLCVIPPHITVEMTSSLHVGALEIQGRLTWTDDGPYYGGGGSGSVPQDEEQEPDETYLCAGYIIASRGGTIDIRVLRHKAWIYLTANGARHPHLGERAFGGVDGASVSVTGRPMARTWTLLDQPVQAGSATLRLLHDPIAMGWRVGDRIGIAPTETQSKGTGQTFAISHVASDGTVLLDAPSRFHHKASFLPSKSVSSSSSSSSPSASTSTSASSASVGLTPMPPVLLSAEVVNLSRNIIITGDDFQNVPCDPNLSHENESQGCTCTSYRTSCTVGLHTALASVGTLQVSHTRIEKCGQRGILGKYCLHMHKLLDCPNCLLSGNAIESSQQRGIVIHDTHRSLVEHNVLWNVRGAGIYIENGNELYNSMEYNVAICPFPLEDDVHHGCTVPGTANDQADTRTNQAGFYLRSSTNDMIGNRAANSRNGMFADAGTEGDARGKVCLEQTELGRWEGNTFHGHARFGTYPINFYPQGNTDRSLDTNGYNLRQSLCDSFNEDGTTRGVSTAIVNHVDYDNIFVGQYDLGNVQYQGHASLNNKNLLYWKETSNFDDGCSAHISHSWYANGNIALPDQATVIVEDTVLENVSLEANHHCKVGSTGFLCMPQYILHNIQWKHADPNANWMYFQQGKTEYGGIFSLSPDSARNAESASSSSSSSSSSPFPPGYVSLVSDRYTYLLDAPNDLCVLSDDLGMGERYDHGILCKAPLRSLKVYTRNYTDDDKAPLLKIEAWFGNSEGVSYHKVQRARTAQFFPFHQVGRTNKQGFALPVLLMEDISYRVSKSGPNHRIPSDWVFEFSDPVMGNRWEEERLTLELHGRACIHGGVVSSHHDRRFIFSGPDFMENDDAWGNQGACVDQPEMPLKQCHTNDGSRRGGREQPPVVALEATSCPERCDSECDRANSYCDCRTATCRCKPGFWGDDCSIDLCRDTCNGGDASVFSGLYLGSPTLQIHNPDHRCIEPSADLQSSRKLRTLTPSSSTSTTTIQQAEEEMDGGTTWIPVSSAANRAVCSAAGAGAVVIAFAVLPAWSWL